MKISLMVAAATAALALSGCGKKDDVAATPAPAAPTASTPTPAPATQVTVSGFAVGNAIGSNKKVRGETSTLGTRDTLYVSVDTNGKGETTLKSRWSYLHDGKSTLVNEDSRKVSSEGPATHEFHISKPDGWPKGDYQVEIFVNDASAGTRRFTVA